jgi:hypothetical protein
VPEGRTCTDLKQMKIKTSGCAKLFNIFIFKVNFGKILAKKNSGVGGRPRDMA